MYMSTQIKTTCTDKALLEFKGLLEIEMSNRAMEDDEDRRRRGQANMGCLMHLNHLLDKGCPKGDVKQGVRARQKPSLNPRLRHKHVSLQLNMLVQMQHGHWKKMLDMEMSYEELNYVTPASACSFYTTFLPTFHAASTQDNSVEDRPENLPILDTGATHCLLPITWLGAEECEKAKRIHLKVLVSL